MGSQELKKAEFKPQNPIVKQNPGFHPPKNPFGQMQVIRSPRNPNKKVLVMNEPPKPKQPKFQAPVAPPVAPRPGPSKITDAMRTVKVVNNIDTFGKVGFLEGVNILKSVTHIVDGNYNMIITLTASEPITFENLIAGNCDISNNGVST